MRRAATKDPAEPASLPPDDSLQFTPIGGVESTFIEADEELIRTAGVATLEADRSQREVERWRLEASAQMHCLTKVRREKALLLREVLQLEKSLEEAREAAAVPTSKETCSLIHGGRSILGDVCDPHGDGIIVVPGTFTLEKKGGVTAEEVELRYLISRAISSLDSLQAEIAALRQQHADLWHRKREITEDSKRLNATYQRQKKQREELLEKKLFVEAAEADPAFREALQKRMELKDLVRHAADRRAALKQLRMERASMIGHLLEGAMSRERDACNLHVRIAKKKGFIGHPMHDMLMALQKENKEIRAKYLQMVRGSKEEDAVLSDYLDVLEERLLLDWMADASHDKAV
ncbi:hypothetical protein TcCL_NonESM01819 [Trypanosoma cruzi]|uniref:Uncharacterized protein n=1 Tax=Trypanosoma cruzi (strain CL Brener) TaxID=353153 RepID=Q4DAB2_TRYCC|nr:hypothetical protein Tc00.1047053511021.90 [Trypanosoma cruzi]EAN89470.1 hypothetical protein Tc00.1047053511021.90 [Trypanosoma cruzi]RNC48223.1 hypothetical protein TcCL_NonESM01819 [Trypanosoma cruzi]|eukprot:XP_811321.1 hypothetical protein [Trypanosoma cruzi strain CL Brener]